MQIRSASEKDLDEIMKIYERARIFMAAHGNPDQWGTSYPQRSLIERDIREGNSYICEEEGAIAAVFYYREGEDATYQTIYDGQWLDDANAQVQSKASPNNTNENREESAGKDNVRSNTGGDGDAVDNGDDNAVSAIYGVIHRIASSGVCRGAASFCLKWALAQCGNVRIDTHRNNQVMQNLLRKNGFSYCGIIFTEDGSERLAFQKK